MRRLIPILASVSAVLADPAAPPVAVPVAEEGGDAPAVQDERPRTESASRQFVIYGSDFPTRGAIALLAEETREALIDQAGDGAEWKHPIVIELRGRTGDKAPPRVLSARYFQVPGGFRLQLYVHLARGKPLGLERSLLELLLIERGLRDKGAEPIEAEVAISPWLVDGLLESIRWDRGDRDRPLYAALFEKNQLFPVEKLLEVEDADSLDAGSRAAYRASAGALVMALLGNAGGKAAMGAMLREMATFEGEDLALLRKHFPGMNLGKASFAKWWALQLAKMSGRPLTQTMTILETEAELERLLLIRFRVGEGEMQEMRPGQFRDLLAMPPAMRADVMKPVVESLGLLRLRAFPAHQPVIIDYLRILGELAADEDKEAEARLHALGAQRAELEQLGKRTRDYLDWYRITNAKELSGDFADYIGLKESLEKPLERTSDPVSNYLRDVQRVYDDAGGR